MIPLDFILKNLAFSCVPKNDHISKTVHRNTVRSFLKTFYGSRSTTRSTKFWLNSLFRFRKRLWIFGYFAILQRVYLIKGSPIFDDWPLKIRLVVLHNSPKSFLVFRFKNLHFCPKKCHFWALSEGFGQKRLKFFARIRKKGSESCSYGPDESFNWSTIENGWSLDKVDPLQDRDISKKCTW